MGSKIERVQGELKRARRELAICRDALIMISALSSQEHVIRAQTIAAKAIGYRYLTTVTVTPEGETPIVVDTDGRILALCPECQKPHSLGFTDTAPSSSDPATG